MKEVKFENLSSDLQLIIIFSLVGFCIGMILIYGAISGGGLVTKNQLKSVPHIECHNETIPIINMDEFKILDKYNISLDEIQYGCVCKFNQCPYLENNKKVCVELTNKQVCNLVDAEGRKIE